MMSDIEARFREGLHRAVANQPRLGPIDIDEVIGRGEAGAPVPVRRTAPRWLAAAAALTLVAGIGVGAWLWRTSAAGVPAVPMPLGTTAAATPLALAGTSWDAIQIQGHAVEASSRGVPRLEFRSATAVRVSDPCNRAEGSYLLSGPDPAVLTFSDWGPQTNLGCRVDQQQRFHKALDETRQARVVPAHGSQAEDVLELRDASGTVVLRFAPARGSGRPEPTQSPASVDPSGTVVVSPDPAVSPSGEQIEVRIRNASGEHFDAVEVHFPSGMKVQYGPLAAGASSDYADLDDPVYSYAWVAVSRDGERVVLQPDDFLGEQRLPAGQYTYVLDLDDAGHLSITLE
jgi:heat shock protein HslJ